MKIKNDDPISCKKETYSSEYLYGVKGSYFKEMSYEDVIKEKIKLGNKLLNKLSDFVFSGKVNLLNKDEYAEITYRISNVKKAIEYNELLLKDLKE